MINFDEVTREIHTNKIHAGHKFLTIHKGKTNALLYVIAHQPDIDKIYFYAKDLYESKYQLLIIKREDVEKK